MIRMNGQSRPIRSGRRGSRCWLADQVEEHVLDGDFLVDARLPTEPPWRRPTA